MSPYSCSSFICRTHLSDCSHHFIALSQRSIILVLFFLPQACRLCVLQLAPIAASPLKESRASSDVSLQSSTTADSPITGADLKKGGAPLTPLTDVSATSVHRGGPHDEEFVVDDDEAPPEKFLCVCFLGMPVRLNILSVQRSRVNSCGVGIGRRRRLW